MIRAVTVTFDVNDETKEVTNVKCEVEGQVKRATRTTKKDEVVVLEDTSIMIREEGKLILNNRMLDTIGAEAGSRINIIYETKSKVKDKGLFPVILVDEKGNKLTKSNTIAYKGNKNVVLAEFGDEFTLEEYKEGIWKLVPTEGSKAVASVEEAIAKAESVEPLLIVDEDDTTEIDEIQFSL